MFSKFITAAFVFAGLATSTSATADELPETFEIPSIFWLMAEMANSSSDHACKYLGESAACVPKSKAGELTRFNHELLVFRKHSGITYKLVEIKELHEAALTATLNVYKDENETFFRADGPEGTINLSYIISHGWIGALNLGHDLDLRMSDSDKESQVLSCLHGPEHNRWCIAKNDPDRINHALLDLIFNNGPDVEMTFQRFVPNFYNPDDPEGPSFEFNLLQAAVAAEP